MTLRIPYGRQDISSADIEAVAEVLRSDFITQGPVVPKFERAVADKCGAKFAVATNSATSALHIACLALGVGKGDLVWTSPITFVASANCARYCGADVDFVDIDPRTYNLSAEALASKLAEARTSGKLPKVVIPVHLSGQSCDMLAIRELGKEYGFRIIEDASHAIGGSYKNAPVGNCRYSDITVFSFHPVKIITTGEGGMALTNDEGIARRLALLCSHGITRDPAEMSKPPEGAWYYQQIALGFNYRMTDIQAALGLSQLSRLDEFVSKRNFIATTYDELLKESTLVIPWQHPNVISARHLYIVLLDPGKARKSHREVFDELRAGGIGVNLHYIPVHLQPYYQTLGYKKGDYPIAEDYYQRAITIPIYPGLTPELQKQVAQKLCALAGGIN